MTKREDPAEIRRIKIEKLCDQVMGQRCNCASINRRAEKIVDTEGMGFHQFCCPKCCYCQWDRALEESDYP